MPWARILYHLLTARPPFQADSLEVIVSQVLDGRAGFAADAQPGVPRDLETICLKCLEKDPTRRYATAQALADELGRFLRGEPILARPIGPSGKVWRWCRRQPVRAGLIAALVAVFGLGLAGVLWQWHRAETHAAAERRQSARAETALREARESLWQANFERAHAWRISGQMGQRVQALAALSNAAALRPSAELRTEAIAALALPDLEDSGVWHPLPAGLEFSRRRRIG